MPYVILAVHFPPIHKSYEMFFVPRNHTFFLDCPYFKHTCVVGSIKKHLGLSHGYENCKRTCTDKSRKYKVVIVIKYPAKSYIIASTH